MDISVFSIYTIGTSFREEFWSCNRTVDFGFLDSYNMWLMKSRKASNSSYLPLMLLIFMLMNFNPVIKLLLFVPQGEDLSFFSFVRGSNLFSVSKFTCSPPKKSEKLKNSYFGQIHVQFHTEFLQWMSIHYGFTYHNCHTELLYDPLGQHHSKDLLFVQYQALSPDSILKSSLSPSFEREVWKHFSHSSHSRSLSDALQYVLCKPHWNLGPGFISISPVERIKIL